MFASRTLALSMRRLAVAAPRVSAVRVPAAAVRSYSAEVEKKVKTFHGAAPAPPPRAAR